MGSVRPLIVCKQVSKVSVCLAGACDFISGILLVRMCPSVDFPSSMLMVMASSSHCPGVMAHAQVHVCSLRYFCYLTWDRHLNLEACSRQVCFGLRATHEKTHIPGGGPARVACTSAKACASLTLGLLFQQTLGPKTRKQYGGWHHSNRSQASASCSSTHKPCWYQLAAHSITAFLARNR